MAKDFDVIAFGATGYTGRLVVEHLLQNYGIGGAVKWAMAGRSKDKLAAVAREIGAPATLPFGVAACDDMSYLDSLADGANRADGVTAARPARPAPPPALVRKSADDLLHGPWPAADDAADEPQLPDDDCLADLLCAARESAEQACTTDQRSRAALYRALGQAYDFALAAEEDPDGYARMLAGAGLRVQARAPMTPIAKLVFGVGYDKTRLTEFAAALSWARRRNFPSGALAPVLGAGGLRAWSRPAARRSAGGPLRRRDHGPARDAAFAHVEIEIPETEDEFILRWARDR